MLPLFVVAEPAATAPLPGKLQWLPDRLRRRVRRQSEGLDGERFYERFKDRRERLPGCVGELNRAHGR